jgi:trimeric autotransporter adhesin
MRVHTPLLALALAGAVAGCGEFARWAAPGEDGGVPAQVTMRAAVHASVGTDDPMAVAVATHYLRQDGSRVSLGQFVATLTGVGAQAVRVPVDLATCLADDQRQVETLGERACSVLFTLALTRRGVEVDRQVVGPVRLTPGGTAQLQEGVSLFEIASIDVLRPDGRVVAPGDSLSMVLGAEVSLGARIRDVRGVVVEGRQAEWRSGAPAVATVSSAGTVTALTLGTVQLTASIGATSRTVALRVVRPPALLSIDASALAGGSGRGVVRSEPAGIDCRLDGAAREGTCSAAFPGDAEVSLRLTAAAGSVPLTWGGACAGVAAEAPCRVTMELPRQVQARFAALRRVSVRAEGDGHGQVTGGEGSALVDCRLDGAARSGRCEADLREGTSLTLRAAADAPLAAGGAAQSMDGWGGACQAATGDVCQLAANDGALDVAVRFFDVRPLAVTLAGGGSGTVLADGTALCTAEGGARRGACSAEATHGARVTLEARPAPDAAFGGWGGACAGESGTRCTVSLTAARQVSATFIQLRRVVVRADSGDGRGRVTGPAGLDCRLAAGAASGTCEVLVPEGAEIDVDARADTAGGAANFLAAWGDACGGATGERCRVTVAGADVQVAVRFVDRPRVIVDLSGSGGGQVIATGISCALVGGRTVGVCERAVALGATVTLTAQPDPFSTFSGWTGGCVQVGGLTCITTLTQVRTVRATFTVRRVQLTVRLSGTEAGTVQIPGTTGCALPAGGGARECTFAYNAGTTVQLQAVAATAGNFAGWSGDCGGAGGCILTLSDDRVVQAVFAAPPPPPNVTLEVVPRGNGDGSVLLNGVQVCQRRQGVNIGACKVSVPKGTAVIIDAVLPSGSRLEAWVGACAGTSGLRCTLTLTRDERVAIGFERTP